MKEELFVFIGDERRQLDLTSPSGITLKWVSNLFNDISKLTCSYSYTFKLPMTSNNRRALNMAEDVRISNGLTRKVMVAEFLINGVCLCPNANLYVNELTDTFSCVMTWRVLKGFMALKDSGAKLTDLPSLGRISWGNEEYGKVDSSLTNMDSILYPDYDAGVPHEAATPPKPVVPIYRLIQMINDAFGVKFDIGRLVEHDVVMMHRLYFNNPSYHGKRVYDDFVSYGVVPLVNSQVTNDRYVVRGVYGIGSHTIKSKEVEYTHKWSIARFGSGSTSSPYRIYHYGIIEGVYTSLSKNEEPGTAGAVYDEPLTDYVGIPVFEKLVNNDYVKALFAFQHDTGLSFYNAKKGEREQIERMVNGYYGVTYSPTWFTRTYTGVERIKCVIATSYDELYRTEAKCTEDTLRVYVYSPVGDDAGFKVGIVGFSCASAFTLRGTCVMRIAKSAVDARRIAVDDYMWMCLAKVTSDKDSLEPVTSKDTSSDVGFMSVDKPSYDAATDTYVCHFDFGVEYPARRISVDADDDEVLVGYVFIPYFPDDFVKPYYKKDEQGQIIYDDEGNPEEAGDTCSLEEGDIYFSEFTIAEIAPEIEAASLPVSMNVTQCLPAMTCLDFMKSVFYMNGAMPRLEADGETITAMYYKQLRDRVNDGDAIDWSDKLLSADSEIATSQKFYNTSFGRNNYFEMGYSSREKSEKDLSEELDKYGNGYGNIPIDDRTLDEAKSIFKSAFHPAYMQNLRYPLIKVGRTCKVWEGDKTLVDWVSPIYGYLVFRPLNTTFEDTIAQRPHITDVKQYRSRMDTFSPFDDEALKDDLFGYLRDILNDYQLIKENVRLSELDLLRFDESVPVYLSKYNSYFAVSSIQRSSDGSCAVEFIRLPRVEEQQQAVDTSYSIEIVNPGTLSFDTGTDGSSAVYGMREEGGTWEELSARSLVLGKGDYFGVTADNIGGSSYPALRIRRANYCQYRYTYTNPDTGARETITGTGGTFYVDGKEWNYGDFFSIYEYDRTLHVIEIVLPIKDQYGAVIETRRFKSPYFVGSKAVLDYGADEKHYEVSDMSKIIKLTLNMAVAGGYSSIYGEKVYSERVKTLNGNHDGRYLYPQNYNIMRGDSYTLQYEVPTSITYAIKEMLGITTLSTANKTVKLRVYYDDQRIVDSGTLTYTTNEFGQYHVFKFIADIVNEAGEVVQRLRKKLYWFVSAVNESVITSDFGDEHNDDKTTKVSSVEVAGDTTICNYKEHNYTLTFAPSYADAGVASVAVTANNDAVAISNVSKSGFIVKASSLPDSSTSVTLTIKTTLEDGSTFTTTKAVSLVKPSVVLSSESSFEATGGNGSKIFSLYLFPNPGTYSIKSVTSSNPKITATKYGNDGYTLSASGITQDETTDVTVIVESDGVEYSATKTYKAIMRDVWSIATLDQAGALIVDRNGKFYSEAEWKASGIINDDADGVAVSDGTHRFIIGKTETTGKIGGYKDNTHYNPSTGQIEGSTTGTFVTGQTTAETESAAYADFNGKANTDAIIAQISDTEVSKIRATRMFPSGIAAYLGTAGEMAIVVSKIEAIRKLLAAIGATDWSYTNVSNDYWTSTQRSDKYEWAYRYKGFTNTKGMSMRLRPFAAVRMIDTPVTRGKIAISGNDTFATTNGAGTATFGINITPAGASVTELSVTSSNEKIVVSNVSNTGFTLSTNGVVIDRTTIVTVRARVNGLIESAMMTVTAIGDTIVDYAKLDSEKALIIGTDYQLYTEEEWYASGKISTAAEGVAVSDGTHRFIIAKKDHTSRVPFGPITAVPGLSTASTYNYDGDDNTDKIISAFASVSYDYAAKVARESNAFPSGEKPYLGSVREWSIVTANYDTIQRLLEVLNVDKLELTSIGYWCSSLYGADNTQAYYWYAYGDDGKWRGQNNSRRADSKYIRPFRKF